MLPRAKLEAVQRRFVELEHLFELEMVPPRPMWLVMHPDVAKQRRHIVFTRLLATDRLTPDEVKLYADRERRRHFSHGEIAINLDIARARTQAAHRRVTEVGRQLVFD